MSEDAIADELMKAADDFGMAMTLDDIARLVNTYPDRGLVRAEILDAVAEIKAERDALLRFVLKALLPARIVNDHMIRLNDYDWKRPADRQDALEMIRQATGLPRGAFAEVPAR